MKLKFLATSVSAAALSLMAVAAHATDLPVQNLTFTDYTGVAPKGAFVDVNPVGWTGGTGLIAIAAPGTASDTGFSPGYYYGVYSGFPNPPSLGNFIQADGNPSFETSFNQVISGLTVGQTYTLSFWQAAGQQGFPTEFSGDTTEQWKVFFGTGSFSVNCGVSPCTVSTSGDMTEYDSFLMNTPSQGYYPWNEVHLNLLATAATETISFLAWGDNGNTTNLPPTVFLAGVNTPSRVSEPAALSLLGIGLLGLGTAGLRRRASRKA